MRILPAFTLLGVLLFTQGCDTTPRIVEKPVYVDVPVPVYCIDEIPNEPRYATQSLTADSDLPTVADAYMVEKHQREIEAKQLRALLVGCVKP